MAFLSFRGETDPAVPSTAQPMGQRQENRLRLRGLYQKKRCVDLCKIKMKYTQ